jgi:hypothetical protein
MVVSIRSLQIKKKLPMQQRRRWAAARTFLPRNRAEDVGSTTDNAILGLDFKCGIFCTARNYGQLVLDEFKIRRGADPAMAGGPTKQAFNWNQSTSTWRACATSVICRLNSITSDLCHLAETAYTFTSYQLAL